MTSEKGRDAYEKIRAGANLVQLYTGLVYRGPWVAELVCRELLGCLKADGFMHISQAVGVDHKNIDIRYKESDDCCSYNKGRML